MNNYYVYVYIDPRNLEEFYFGKGRGSRKDAHLSDTSDSEKARRIAAIHKAGLKPIVRVIARDLSEHDALLVEKTLLWKLGRQLTNISSGHYSENFRPHNTMHLELSGFDYQSGVYYYNIGEGAHRSWDDYKKFGFISAGQGARWRDAMLGFQKGDVVAAYLKNYGFVGIGVLTDRAKPIREITIKGKPLLSYNLHCQRMSDNAESDEKCEYVAPVTWAAAVECSQAKWKAKGGLYTTTHVRASLDGHPTTIDFLETEFGIKVRELVA
ncbi:LEM-3-like GIY-YIG domain-containing protein [Chlorobium sp.]|uniref:LEM-3-like GIY-YIG domain-containing protein n=1 Tax=Chlorobium sp. TaxID=1095 RepID=UPI003C47A00E